MHTFFRTIRRFTLLALTAALLLTTLSGCISFSFPSSGSQDTGGSGDTPLFNPDGEDDPISQSTEPSPGESEEATKPQETETPTEPSTHPTEEPTEPTTEPTEPPTEPTTAPTEPPVYADPIAYGVVTGDVVNVRSGPGTGFDVVDEVTRNTRVEIYARSGNWGELEDGWISLDYVYIDGTVGPNGTVMGTVNGTGVNIRSGPGTKYNVVGQTNTGDRLEILHRITLGDMTWGCTKKGWVCMDYVIVDGEEPPTEETTPSETTEETTSGTT